HGGLLVGAALGELDGGQSGGRRQSFAGGPGAGRHTHSPFPSILWKNAAPGALRGGTGESFMEYRENKRLNARVSLLGFGGMRFPTDGEGKIREAEAAGMLRRALEGGVNYFDTAHYYHDSQSEGFLGRALAGVPRDSYYLATKLPVWKAESVSDGQAIFDLQL